MADDVRSPLTVAVTGAAGYLAGRVIRLLHDAPEVGRVLAFDVRPAPGLPPATVYDTLDVRDEALQARLEGVDVLVHLAFVMDPIKDETEMRDINVNGSQNVFRCAGKAGVGKIVYTSSAVAYGAHPDNDFPLTESSPLRANLDFSYAAHKLEVEYVVREFTEEYEDVTFTVLRPAIVFGPSADNAWSHLLEMPVIFSVAGYEPRFQFVHEDDVARAIVHCVLDDLPGAYNVGPSDHLGTDEIVERLGRRRVDLPEPAAFAVAERLWALGLGEAPAGMLHYVMHPWVVDASKLQATGFSFEHSAAETFAEVAERVRGSVRLGPRRFERRNVGRAVAASGALAGALVAARLVRGALRRVNG